MLNASVFTDFLWVSFPLGEKSAYRKVGRRAVVEVNHSLPINTSDRQLFFSILIRVLVSYLGLR
jgi:hypothetical protein